MLNVGKQAVTHGFDQGFGSPGVVHAEGVLAHNLDYSHRQDGEGHDPKVLPQITEAANGIYRIHNKSRDVAFLAAQSAVYRRADDLGLEHIRQRRYAGSQHGHQKVPLCSF